MARRIGSFEFQRIRSVAGETCLVDVYPMFVDRQLRTFDEMGERTVRLCNLETALAIVASKPLAAIIEQFAAEFGAQRLAAGE